MLIVMVVFVLNNCLPPPERKTRKNFSVIPGADTSKLPTWGKIHKRPGGIPAGPPVMENSIPLLVGFHALRRLGIRRGGATKGGVVTAHGASVFKFGMGALLNPDDRQSGIAAGAHVRADQFG